MELRLQKEFQPNIGALVAYIARTGNGCNLSCHVFVKTICPEFTQRCIPLIVLHLEKVVHYRSA